MNDHARALVELETAIVVTNGRGWALARVDIGNHEGTASIVVRDPTGRAQVAWSPCMDVWRTLVRAEGICMTFADQYLADAIDRADRILMDDGDRASYLDLRGPGKRR